MENEVLIQAMDTIQALGVSGIFIFLYLKERQRNMELVDRTHKQQTEQIEFMSGQKDALKLN